jgi:hypothetical protein
MKGARHHDAIYPKPILAHISLFQHVIYEALPSVLDSFNAAKIASFPESTNFFQENPGNFLFFKKIALPLRFRYSKRKTKTTENYIELWN